MKWTFQYVYFEAYILFLFLCTFQMHEDGDEDHIEQQFIERFNDLRRYDKYSDCSFKVEGHVINAHKLILTAASPVFEAQFYGPLGKCRFS